MCVWTRGPSAGTAGPVSERLNAGFRVRSAPPPQPSFKVLNMVEDSLLKRQFGLELILPTMEAE